MASIFYFYAMPFVVADDGIIYSKMEPLEFEGVNYPGIRISYESDIGFSPEDEYFIYYNASTNEMAWLGYTVTYFTKEKSKDVHWIRYDDWGDHNGLRLPNSLSWYKYENGLPTEFRNEVEFTNISVTENELSEEVFAKPVRADYVAPTRLND